MKIGSSYKFVVEVDGRILTFTGKINSIDDDFISFTDKFGKNYSYNKNNIVSLEAIA